MLAALVWRCGLEKKNHLPGSSYRTTCASVVALQTLSDTQRPESATLVKVKRGPEKNPHVGHMWTEHSLLPGV